VRFHDAQPPKAFFDALRCRNGNLNISGGRVKYAAEGTGIAFSLEKTKKGVLLSSVNVSRTPLAPEELDKLFDRFYRADPARSGTGGFGIGLSIARSIAEGHKGGIRASLEDGKICFRAELRNMK